MPTASPQLHMDVSNTIDVTDARAVASAVTAILSARYGEVVELQYIDRLVADFDRLYAGEFPGFHGCEIKYHDAQHVLDVTLAMARLIDGYEKIQSRRDEFGVQLGAQLALVGIAGALFHDAGYIRRIHDSRNKNGAAYTRTHVSRSARFLMEYLPEIGLGHLAELCARVVQFTDYQVGIAEITVTTRAERRLGELLGTADLIAQMADSDYPRKCGEHLYEEFEIGGMAGENGRHSHNGIVYQSPEHLLEATPEFMRNTIEKRLKGDFNYAYRYAEVHFQDANLYMEAIERNRIELQTMIATPMALRKRRLAVGA
jgi:hypothetical protein